MPSTTTSRPPSLVLVTRASTIRPLRRFSSSPRRPRTFRERISKPSSVSKWSTITSIMSPGWGRASVESVDRQDPSLLAPRSTKMLLPRMAMTLPVSGAAAGSALLAPLAAGPVSARSPGLGTRRGDVEFRRVEPLKRGFQLGLEIGVPLPLEWDFVGRPSLGTPCLSASSARSRASSIFLLAIPKVRVGHERVHRANETARREA